MKFKIKCFSFFLLLSFGCFETSDQSPCEDWQPYKETHCYKILNEDKLYTNDEARDLCIENGGTLLQIRYQKEQVFLEKFIFVDSEIHDNVWLGAKYDIDVGDFKWEDGTNLTFTNWQTGYPKSRAPDSCIQLNPERGNVGKWRDATCRMKSLIVCEKPQNLSLGRIQEILFELKQNFIELQESHEELAEFVVDLKQSHTQLQGTVADLKRSHTLLEGTVSDLSQSHAQLQGTVADLKQSHLQLEGTVLNLLQSHSQLEQTVLELKNSNAHLQQNTVPIGFIYVQLPNERSPTEIWSWMVWADITESYAGLFFRAEGNGAAPFGQIQEANTTRLVEVNLNTFRYRIATTIQVPENDWSGFVSLDTTPGGSYEPHLRFRNSGGEVRPRNMAMKIWKRVL